MLNQSVTQGMQQRSAASTLFPTWAIRHTASLKPHWLQPSVWALSSCDIAMTEAYFHNKLSGSTFLSTSRISAPVIHFLHLIHCVGWMYGDVIYAFCKWHMRKKTANSTGRFQLWTPVHEQYLAQCLFHYIHVKITFSITSLRFDLVVSLNRCSADKSDFSVCKYNQTTGHKCDDYLWITCTNIKPGLLLAVITNRFWLCHHTVSMHNVDRNKPEWLLLLQEQIILRPCLVEILLQQ